MRSGFSAVLALVALVALLSLSIASAKSEDCAAAVNPILRKLEEAKSQYAELHKTWQKQAAEIEALQGTVSDLTSKLEASKAKLDLATIAVALVDLAKEGTLAAWDETKTIFEELKGGKTTKLEARVASTLSAFRGAASSAAAFVRKEADEHLPEPVKQQLAAGAAKAQALWKEHVTDAAWAQPVLAQLSSVNDEVTKVVYTTLSSMPALAPLADPVTVQLVVYAVFALPVLLLLLLPLLLLGASKKKPAPCEAGKPGSGKKKKPAKRA